MAGNLNKVQLIGHVGSDPETRAVGESAVATISVATTRRWRDKAGEQQEQTEWHRCVAWGKLADIVANFIHRGSLVYIEGRLQTRKWTDKEGVDRYTTEIVAESLTMLDKRGDNNDKPPQQRAETPPPKAVQPRRQPVAAGGDFDNMDDDIPY